MAGRRRRLSNSTVQTVDEATLRPKRESKVLKPVPAAKAEHDWPTFVLTDAVVYRMDGITLGNPLLVDTEGPFVIRGQLEIDDKDQESLLVRANTRAAYIEIARSNRFAIGYVPVSFWVSGAAGWYEIRPAPKYRAMYAEILQAITLYYEIMGACESYDDLVNAARSKRKGKKGKPPPRLTIDHIFLQYARAVGDGVFYDEAVARCDRWAQFFISHFQKETEYNWEGNIFFKWMLERHPDVQQTLADADARTISQPRRVSTPREIEGSEEERSRSRATRGGRPNSDLEDALMTDAPPEKGDRRASGLKEHSNRRVSTPPRRTAGETGPVLFAFIHVLDEILVDCRDAAKVDERTIRQKMFFKCKVSYERPIEMAKYFSRGLLEHLGPHWASTPFYRWLKVVSQQKPDDLDQKTIDSFQHNLSYRERKDRSSAATASNPSSSRAQTEDTESAREVRQGKRPFGKRTSGKLSTLRPRKRLALDADMEEASPTSHRQRTGSAAGAYMEYGETDGSDANGSDKDNTSVLTPDLDDPVRLLVHAEKLPTLSPSGPDGTWLCEEEGCDYMVRRADDDEGKQLIEAHFKEHERRAQRLHLAMEEGTRGRNPIEHLIQKLQMMRGNASDREADSRAESGPAAIKRRLLI